MTDKNFPQSQLPIRKSSEFLPKIFQTSTNEKFMEAVVDPLIQPGTLQKTVGYIGRRYGKTYQGTDIYLDTDTTLRSRYQLEPGVIYSSQDNVESFYDYLDFKNQLKFFGNYNERDDLTTSHEQYTWNPPIDWDKFVNYREYYWVPQGPTLVSVYGQSSDVVKEYKVTLGTGSSFLIPIGNDVGINNPTLTLYRGQTYKFKVNAPNEGFSIRTNLDTGSLLFNPFVTYFKGQIVSFNEKLWKATAILPPSDGSNIYEGSPDWQYIEDVTSEISLEYINGVTNNGVQTGILTFEVPYNAPDILYYQGIASPDRAGMIIISDIESNAKLDVEQEILGMLSYQSANGIKFSNGLVVKFRGQVTPASYAEGSWLVEGVSTGIKLVKFDELTVPEVKNTTTEVLFDNQGFDTIPFDDASEYPIEKDYILINRSSNDSNAWSRYNRWFHRSVLEYSAQLAGTTFDATEELRAKRPIIEFLPNLNLFNHGVRAKQAVDFIDDYTTDVFSTIEGSRGYNVDGEQLFDGARLLVIADKDSLANNRVYQVKFIKFNGNTQIALTRVDDTDPVVGESVRVRRGNTNKGVTFHFNGTAWIKSQSKTGINQSPLFDAYTPDGTSFSNTSLFQSSTFTGTPLLKYKLGTGKVDTELGFKLSYLNIDNVGDIEFDWTWDTEEFYYVENNRLQTRKLNTGFYQFNNGEYANGWISANLDYIQPMIDSVTVETPTSMIGTSIIDWTNINSDSEYTINFYLNGDKITEKYVRTSNIFTFGSDLYNYTFNESILDADPGVGYIKLNDTDAAYTSEVYINITDNTNKSLSQFIKEINDNENSIKGYLKITEKASTDRFVLFEINSTFRQEGSYIKLPVTYLSGPRISIANQESLEVILTKNVGALFNTSDVVSMKLITDAEPNTGYYQIPSGLEKNPLNQDLTAFTLGQAVNHIYSAMEFNNEFAGTIPGTSNLRDLAGYQPYARRFLKHSSIVPLSMYLFCDKKNNIIKAIQAAKRSYTEFKNKFLQKAIEIDYVDNIAEFVDSIMADLTRVKGATSPYVDSDMIGTGAYTQLEYAVEDIGITTFALSESFDLNSLSRRAVYVYINNQQLLNTRDYEFNSAFGFIKINVNLTEGDRIVIREYISTATNYIPPTPTKMGLYKKYTPMKFIDDTYREPTEVIQGHDGSITVAYGDFRDDLLLELEYRIYNNIKQEYDSAIFDIDQVVGSYYNNSLYNKDQLDLIVSQEFLKWIQNTNTNYTINQYFAENETFTYTYSNMTDPTGNYHLPGWWRGVYQWFYDTDRPHRCPWEMLGFSEMPTWWENEYGPAPYTSNNLLLWEDLRDGIVRQGNRAGTYDRYKRPSIMEHIPVDGDGKLLSPLDSNLARNFVLINNKGDFALGDVAPAEYAWRSSSEWPFALTIAMCLLKPFDFITDMFDRSNTDTNIIGQTINKNTSWFQTLDSISSLSDENILTTGLVKYLVDYARYQGTSLTDLDARIRGLDVKLSTRLSGFVDKEQQKYLLDSKNPSSTSSSIFVPPENYDIIFNVSSPISFVAYSGIIIEKTSDGWIITGYDDQQPYFNYFEAVPNQKDPIISVGGVSDTYVIWASDKTYANGQIVLYQNYYYRCLSTHLSGTEFQSTLWAKLPALPVVGAVEAYRRRNFNTLKVKQLSYGTKLTTIQQVVDIILGYEQYLKSQGFEFNGYDIEHQVSQDWLTSAKEFMFWTKHNWAAESLITLSPGALTMKINVPVGVVDNLLDGFYDYQVLSDNGKPLPINQINLKRSFQSVEIESVNADEGIYYLKLFYVLKEHVTIFSDRTVFNDVIYDKTTGYRQERIKVQGFRTVDWDGDYTSPGFLFDNVNIQVWQPFTDYKLGDIVAYRSYYWTSQRNQVGVESFDESAWSKLDSNPTKQLVPNFDYKINQIEDYYNVDAEGIGESQRVLARHAIGYQTREYLQNIAADPITQFQLYQGFIREKGTKNAIVKVFDKLSRSSDSSIVLNEEWAFRVGRLGGVDQLNEYEILLDKNSFKVNPQPIEVSTSKPINVVDQVYRVTKDDFNIYPKPYTTNINPVALQNIQRTAGYVRSDQVSFIVKTIDDILDLDIAEFYENDHVWVTFDNTSWTVLRYNQARSIYPVAVEIVDLIVTVTLKTKHMIRVGDIVGLEGITNLSGFFKVSSTTWNTISIELTSVGNPPEIDTNSITAIYIFTDATAEQYADVDFNKSAAWSSGSKLWVDNNGQGHWEVIEKRSQYSYSRITGYGIAEPLKAGYKVFYSNALKHMLVGTPATRFVQTGFQNLLSTSTAFFRREAQDFLVDQPAGVYGYEPGRRVRIEVATDPNAFMEGTIISFIEESLIVSIDHVVGTGSNANWVITIISNGGQVLVYAETTTGLKLRDLVLAGDAFRSKESFGTAMSVSPDGQWLVVAAPSASFVPNDFLGDYDVDENYVNESIVLYNDKLYQAQEDIISDGSTVLDPLVWKEVSNITGDVGGLNTGGVHQGMICLYKYYRNRWDLRHTYVSPRVDNLTEEYFGSDVAVGQTDTTYYMAVTAVGADNQKGRVYLYTLDKTDVNATWEFLEYISPTSLVNDDRFGYSVAMSKDGSIICVGAVDSSVTTIKTGQAFVYKRNSSNSYVLKQVLDNNMLTSINDIEGITTYAISTHVRIDPAYPLYTIRVANTAGMVEDMPIKFEGTPFGGIQAGTTYYIDKISQRGTYGLISIKAELLSPNIVTLTNAKGSMQIYTDLTSIIKSGDKFGYSVDLDETGSTLIVSAPKSDINFQDQGSAFILRTDNIDNPSYRLKQKITSAEVNPDEYFGHSVSISGSGDRLVIGAKNSPYNVKTVFDSNNTTFDQTRTTFVDRKGVAGAVFVYELKDSKFFLVEKLEADLGDYESFGFSVDCDSNAIAVGSPTYKTPIFDGVNYTFTGPEVGSARLFKRKVDAESWEVIASQDPSVNLNLIKSIALYDPVKNIKIQDIDYVDVAKLKVLNLAEQEIKFKTPYDPAIYSYGTDSQVVDEQIAWVEKHKGEIWWDISTFKSVYYEQGEISYRSGNWNRLAVGASVDIYEWVESRLLPSEWAAVADTNEGTAAGISGQPLYPNDNVLSVKVLYNPTTGEAVETLYYYWVKNKTIVPNLIPGRRISAYSIASLIENPAGSGIAFIAISGPDKLLAYNFKSIIDASTAYLNIQYRKSLDDLNPIHNEYQLLTEGDPTNLPTNQLEVKWLDSLIGYNEIGERVPDITLSDKEKYGISFRPRQSMFIDRPTILKEVVDSINSTLKKEAFADTISFDNLNLVDEIPNAALNLYDITVDTEVDLSATDIRKVQSAKLTPEFVDGKLINVTIDVPGTGYKTVPPIIIDGDGTGARVQAVLNDRGSIVAVNILDAGRKYNIGTAEVRGYSVLVLNDSTVGNIWSIYAWDNERDTYYRTLSRRYDTTKYWSFVDWWEADYGITSKIIKEIPTIKDEPSVGIQLGDLVRVKEYTNGGWAVFEKINDIAVNFADRYKMVGRQNGTIQIDQELYDVNINKIGYDNVESFDIGLYDIENFRELRNILTAVHNDIFIGSYQVEWNKLFFTCVRYAFAEQQYIDWAFKTSFLNVLHNVGDFEQKLNYQNDNLSSYQEYIEEVKPYSTTVREYVSKYTNIDVSNTQISDFDLPSANSETTGTIISGFTIEQLRPGIPTDDRLGYSIVSIDVRNSGDGYTQPPTVIIEGTGVGATAIAYISNGKVKSIRVTNLGYGYTQPPAITLVGGNGSNQNVATAAARLGDAKTRTFNTTIKFDRITKTGLFTTNTQEETFEVTGSIQTFDLMYLPSMIKNKFTAYKNDVILLKNEYEVTEITTSTGAVTGRLILIDTLIPGDSIRVVYERSDSILDSVDRIEKHYAPTSGMKGKDLSQLMTGIDFGGVQLQGTTFDITGGWDAIPWFTDGWDNVESFDQYLLIEEPTTIVTLPFTPKAGEKVTIYIRKDGELFATRLDDENWDTPELITNPTAVMPTFIGDGFNETIDFTEYDIQLNQNDTLIFRPIDSDGAVTINDINLLDTYLNGGDWQVMQSAYTTATGTTADEIIVEGERFISPDQVPAPEENVPGQVLDGFSIKVYSASEGTAAPLQSVVADANGLSTQDINVGIQILETTSILVYVDKQLMTLGNDYTLNPRLGTVTFAPAPALGSLIEVLAIGIGGVKLLDYKEFEADGSTQLFLTGAPYDVTTMIFVTVDGVEDNTVTFINSEDIAESVNRTMAVFNVAPESGSIIKILSINSDDTNNIPVVRVNRQETIFTNDYLVDDTVKIDLINFINYPTGSAASSMIVEVNNRALQGVDSETFVYDGVTSEFMIGIDPQELSGTVVSSNIQVFVNGYPLTAVVDYSFNLISKIIKIQPSILSVGDIINIENNIRSEYTVEDNQLIIKQPFADSSLIIDGDTISIIWFNEYPLMGIISDEDAGGRSVYRLVTNPINTNYIWVYVNGYRLTPYEDYYISVSRLAVILTVDTIPSDVVKIISFGSEIYKNPSAFEIHKDMLNTFHYNRFSSNGITLTSDLKYYDKTIAVSDVSLLPNPNVKHNQGGIVYINGERIEYMVKDITNNTLSQLRRGHLGTPIAELHAAGSKVINVGLTENIPYRDTQTRTDVISDGSSMFIEFEKVLAKSNREFYRETIPAEFGPCDQIEVFVNGRRLRKDSMVIFDESLGSISPAGDITVEAEFSVDGTSSAIRLTEVPPEGSTITIIEKTGKVWYDSTESSRTLLENTNTIAKFIAAKTTNLPE